MKRFVLIGFVLFLASCSNRILNTGQDLEIALVGTDEAYCTLSTPVNRYSLRAPGTAFVERDDKPLKIDCRDKFSDRRRVVTVESDISMGYYRYPDKVTVDFATLENGTRFNGFRAEAPAEVSATPVLTQDSFSKPVETTQNYPVAKTYSMGRRSYPVSGERSGVTQLISPSSPNPLMPMIDSNNAMPSQDPSVTVYPIR